MPASTAALVTQTRAHLQRRAPQYKRWLQRLVQIQSYTRDPAGVRSQAQATADMFTEQLRYPLNISMVDSEAACHGPHLVLRSGTPDTLLDRPRARPVRPVIGMVSHLDTVRLTTLLTAACQSDFSISCSS